MVPPLGFGLRSMDFQVAQLVERWCGTLYQGAWVRVPLWKKKTPGNSGVSICPGQRIAVIDSKTLF